MVPTPRELTSDCGMALEIGRLDVTTLDSLANSRPLRWHAIYQQSGDGYSRLEVD